VKVYSESLKGMILVSKQMESEALKLKILKIFLWINGAFLFFWWPLSHWFYSDFYHTFLGFKLGSYQNSLVKIIGTCGIIPVLLLLFSAKDPIKNRDSIISLITFSILLAATFSYLILKGDFPIKEYINVGFLSFSALFLIFVYPWKYEKTNSK
jgi:hypothetical protein